MAKTSKATEAATDNRTPAASGEPSDAEMIAARTTGDVPADERFYREFVILARDYQSGNQEELHRANRLAVLQEAMNRGLHPKGTFADVRLELEEKLGEHALRSKESIKLTYSVPVVPATRDGEPAGTLTPSRALEELDGTTIGQDKYDANRTGFNARDNGSKS